MYNANDRTVAIIDELSPAFDDFNSHPVQPNLIVRPDEGNHRSTANANREFRARSIRANVRTCRFFFCSSRSHGRITRSWRGSGDGGEVEYHWWCDLKPTFRYQEAGLRREHDEGLRARQRLDGQSAIGRLHTAGAPETHDAPGPDERHPDVGGEVRGHFVAGQARGRLRGVHQQGEESSRLVVRSQ